MMNIKVQKDNKKEELAKIIVQRDNRDWRRAEKLKDNNEWLIIKDIL